jgi:hypothetical protein
MQIAIPATAYDVGAPGKRQEEEEFEKQFKRPSQWR